MMTKEQVEDLAKEACWEDGEWACDAHCYKCTAGHWKRYKNIVKFVVRRWEKIKGGIENGNNN